MRPKLASRHGLPAEGLSEAVQLLGSLHLLLQLHLLLPAKESPCETLHVAVLFGSIVHCPLMPALLQEGLPGLPGATLREVPVHHRCMPLQHITIGTKPSNQDYTLQRPLTGRHSKVKHL